MSVGERDDDEGKRHTKLEREGGGGGGGRGKSTGCLSRDRRGSGADELNNKTLPRPIITASEGTGQR